MNLSSLGLVSPTLQQLCSIPAARTGSEQGGGISAPWDRADMGIMLDATLPPPPPKAILWEDTATPGPAAAL